jgi:hypothetical protein
MLSQQTTSISTARNSGHRVRIPRAGAGIFANPLNRLTGSVLSNLVKIDLNRFAVYRKFVKMRIAPLLDSF